MKNVCAIVLSLFLFYSMPVFAANYYLPASPQPHKVSRTLQAVQSRSILNNFSTPRPSAHSMRQPVVYGGYNYGYTNRANINYIQRKKNKKQGLQNGQNLVPPPPPVGGVNNLTNNNPRPIR